MNAYAADDVLEPELEPDDEEEDNGPEVGNATDELVVTDEAERARPDQEPDKDDAHHGGLIDARRQEVPAESSKEKEAHLELGGRDDRFHRTDIRIRP